MEVYTVNNVNTTLILTHIPIVASPIVNIRVIAHILSTLDSHKIVRQSNFYSSKSTLKLHPVLR